MFHKRGSCLVLRLVQARGKQQSLTRFIIPTYLDLDRTEHVRLCSELKLSNAKISIDGTKKKFLKKELLMLEGSKADKNAGESQLGEAAFLPS